MVRWFFIFDSFGYGGGSGVQKVVLLARATIL